MTASGRVANKVALVTGAASGIGKATALLLAKEGATVVVADIAAETGQQVVEEISRNGGRAFFLPLDVADESAWRDVTDRILHDFGRLDIVVNDAGIAVSRPVIEMTFAEWRRVLQINLDGVFLGTKYAIRAMQSGSKGSIINVASASGIKASAGASAYCSSKAAVRMFSKTAALECAAAGSPIRVNIVSPGGVKTPIWENMEFWPGLVAQHGSEEPAWKALPGSSSVLGHGLLFHQALLTESLESECKEVPLEWYALRESLAGIAPESVARLQSGRTRKVILHSYQVAPGYPQKT